MLPVVILVSPPLYEAVLCPVLALVEILFEIEAVLFCPIIVVFEL
jgi:hypothetical protein